MNISALYATMGLLFITMAVGFGARKIKVVDESFMPNLSRIVITVFQPCLILASVANKEKLLGNMEVLSLTGIALLCYAVLLGLALVLPRLFGLKTDQGIYRFMFIFANIGFMGYPVVESLFGTAATFYVTIFVLIFSVLLFTLGSFLLSGDKSHIGLSVELFKKPTIYACILAYVVYCCEIPIPTAVADACTYLGALTTPCSMVLIGCALGDTPLKGILGSPKLYGMLLLKMMIVPVVLYFALRPFVADPLILGVVTVLFAMPVATNATMMATVYGGNVSLASTGVLVSTVCSVGTIPLLMGLLFG